MFYLTPYSTTVCLFAALAVSAAYQDVRNFTLPNIHSLLIVALYPVFVVSSVDTVQWFSSIGVAAAALLVGFILFSLKYCGGGDAKFFAAVSLWAGPSLVLDFTLLTTVTGGAISIGLWLFHRMTLMVPFLPQGSSCDSETFAKKPMPYGVAIAVGAVYVAFTLLR